MDENKLEEAMTDTIEQSFNDTELEDIMNEIESLEKEFVDEGDKSPEDLALSEAPTSSLQNEIDKEVESIAGEMTTAASEEVSEVEAMQEEVVAQEVNEAPQAEVEQPEVTESLEVVSETVETESIDEVSNVVSLPVSENKVASSGANMDFSATGSMDLNLNFKIGSETATLKVDGDSGLVVEMGGVEIKITESNGCTVTMEGGVNFNIPLTTSSQESKKKAA
ncbi:hypothetical protein [Halobacteriovorax sp. HLS]|uniref:hypothetical protein n=1 Tax=Halobacteriovorax sp. HLS TaxID=2234000 RepID=UPI000FD9EC7A|nr:hypothetical protein [Halobacteriovorax sp. HLS]